MKQANKDVLVTCLVLGVVIFWLSGVIIDLERYRYANQTLLCEQGVENYAANIQAYSAREECLRNATPRTSGLWDLYYALSD